MSSGTETTLEVRGWTRESMAEDVLASLTAPLPELPSKYFYDDEGSHLFEAITRLPEYYLTRTEESILEGIAGQVIDRLRPRELVEIGSGVGRKIRILLETMARSGLLERCVFFDINAMFLNHSVQRLQELYPALRVRGVRGDLHHDLANIGPGRDRLFLFLGSTIGNLHPSQVPGFLTGMRELMGPGEGFLVGLDLVKDPAVLEAAYNDAAGVTARFNKNILAVVNRELGADFDPAAFEHVAFYEPRYQCMEMRLRAKRACKVSLPSLDLTLELEAGQEIRTELSCKYTRESFEAKLASTGLEITGWYTDARDYFALALLEPQSQ